jgi:Tfp pilus assembly protein PilX
MNPPFFKNKIKQAGFLSIVAILLIVAVGFLGLVVTHMIVGSASATNSFAESENAFYATEAGFEQAARLLLNPTLSGTNGRITCAALTGNSNLTNESFGDGTFTASMVSGSPYYANSTLAGALTASTSTISVASTSGFAPAGRLIIEGEVVNYGAISGNSFIGVQRGVNFSPSTPHVSGAYVSQYQCNVDVKAGIPNLTSPLYQRETQQALQLQEGWAVGAVSGSNFVMTRWNRPTEETWSSSTLNSSASANLLSVSMLSNGEGWAVGAEKSNVFTILRWQGSSWSVVSTPSACSNTDLAGVSTVYRNEAWAVGPTMRNNGSCSGGGSRRYTILLWNGSSWSLLTPSTAIPIPADNSSNQDLNAIHVIDTTQSGSGNFGFAVGDNGTILRYNGSAWTTVSSPTTRNLMGVFVVSANEAWAVGVGGTIIKWNGSTWSTVTSPTSTQLNSITMLDSNLSGTANAGWAVGNSGVAVRYNGSSWSSNNTGASSNLFGVAMFFTPTGQDVWAVGGGGNIRHYDGSAWTSVASGVSQQLNGISLIKPQQTPFAWQEIFA